MLSKLDDITLFFVVPEGSRELFGESPPPFCDIRCLRSAILGFSYFPKGPMSRSRKPNIRVKPTFCLLETNTDTMSRRLRWIGSQRLRSFNPLWIRAYSDASAPAKNPVTYDLEKADPAKELALRSKQAPNRDRTWAPSQRPRSDAFNQPRFEGAILEMQVCLWWSEYISLGIAASCCCD